MAQITVFKTAYIASEPFYCGIEVVVKAISSNKYRDLVEQIRRIEDKKERDIKKRELPSILFSGKFTKRRNDAIQEHSGYVCLDFDKLGSRMAEVKEMLLQDAHTVLLFESPSGNGLKCVFRIPAKKETHRDSCRAIKSYFSHEPNYDHFPDEARICFISFDPDAYFNPNASVFKAMEKEPEPKYVEVTELVSDHDLIYANLKKWLESKHEYYEDGNKHKFLVKLAGACNRFGVDQYTCLHKLKFDFLSLAPVSESDFERIVKKVYTNYQNQHGTQFFDRTNKICIKENEKVKQVEDIAEIETELAKDVIYVDDIRSQVKSIFHSGFKKAESTHYNAIDNHWKWKQGELTLMSGILNHGKSTLMLQLMLIKSVFDKTKWAVFSPEQNPPDEFYLDLAHTYLGKPTCGDTNRKCSEDELDAALDFLNDHFFFIYPENDVPTPEYINQRFLEVIKKHGVHGCMIDPFNQLDNDIKKFGGREDLYISAFLSQQKRFALEHKQFMLVVAHPNSNLSKVKDKNADNFGNYECPDIYDLSGGAMWGNKCDNVLITYRPFYSTDSQDTRVQFISKKIKKQRLVGIPGICTLTFDRKTNRYYEDGERCPLPAPYLKQDGEPKPRYNSYASMQTHTNLVDWDKPGGPF